MGFFIGRQDMSLIDVKGLTFAYDGSYDNIFENVSFGIDTDWKLGFVGRNGRGKTTFLKLLLDGLEYRGSITASVTFEYFPYRVADDTRDVSQVIFAVALHSQRWRQLQELNKLSVGDVIDRPFCTLSNGERTKVLLAAMFLRENSFLLIDEPTNHLDAAGRRAMADYLAGKSGFIVVSHDRDLLDRCTDHTLAINRTDIELTRGSFSVWYQNKMLRANYELKENERLQKDISRLKKSASQAGEWADRAERSKIGFDPKKASGLKKERSYIGEASRRMQARRKNLELRREREVGEKEKLLKNVEKTERIGISPLENRQGALLSLRDVFVDYGCGRIFPPVSLELATGDRMAVRGLNGCGKSSLLKLICGEDIPHGGEVFMQSGIKLSYLPQGSQGLSGTAADYAAERAIDVTLLFTLLRKMDFSRDQLLKPMQSFSEGQKRKVLIAASLCERANIYVWDEPLNFIDIFSRIQIEQLITEFEPTMIFVEHDSAFCRRVCTKELHLK